MNVLLINGSPHKNGCTYTALAEVAKTLEAEGIETTIFHIGAAPVGGCVGCGGCAKAGKCVFGGPVVDVLPLLERRTALSLARRFTTPRRQPGCWALCTGCLTAPGGICATSRQPS